MNELMNVQFIDEDKIILKSKGNEYLPKEKRQTEKEKSKSIFRP